MQNSRHRRSYVMAELNKLENISLEEKKVQTEREENLPSRQNVLEKAKSESDAKMVDDKNGKNFKYSQRSLRRGSGTGSPNSQLPRYPAFDFSEQEDVHSLFPSPSEPEANRNVKPDNTPVVLTSEEASVKDQFQSGSLLKDTNAKKKDTNKSKTLMPELMENSETESTKGSFECEVPEMLPSSESSTLPVPDIAFPSLPNTFLAKLGVHKDSPLSVHAFDEQDLESKFIALSLAFKTDRTTLSKRLELHKRQRDMAEKNVDNEFQAMRDHLKALNLKATSSDVRDFISKIQNHLDIAQQATARVSGRSETYGAVQQEERVSRAFEVLVLHVDHLKRLFDKEHKELEETRKMLTDTRVFRKDVSLDVEPEDQKKYSKTFGLPVGSIKSVGRRRASVADFHQRSFLENCRTPSFSQSWTSGLNTKKVEPLQTAAPYSTVSTVCKNSVSVPTSPDTDTSNTIRNEIKETNVRRSSLHASSPLAPNNIQKVEASPKERQPVSFFSQKNLIVKQERNIWTRKLSAVTDVKEQSEEETDTVTADKKEEIDKSSTHNQESVRFLLEVEKKNNTMRQYQSNHNLEETELSEEWDSVMISEEHCDDFTANIIRFYQNSRIGKHLNIPALHQLWQQNSTCTLVRYFCSGVFVFIAVCILLSMILSVGGIHLNFDLGKNFCFTLLNYMTF